MPLQSAHARTPCHSIWSPGWAGVAEVADDAAGGDASWQAVVQAHARQAQRISRLIDTRLVRGDSFSSAWVRARRRDSTRRSVATGNRGSTMPSTHTSDTKPLQT